MLEQVRFTTGKRKLNIQYRRLGIRFASRVAKRLKTWNLRKLENIRKTSNLRGHMGLAASLPSRTKTLRIAVKKNTQKQIPTFFFPAQLYRISPSCFTHPVRDCRGRRGRDLPCTFSEIRKKCPNFRKKCLDCRLLWVKFLI